MQRIAPLLLGATLLTCGAGLAVPAAAAARSPGIKVYTWTDAHGTTHFSDMPRHQGPARQLILPTPPPADQTAVAADRAWVRKQDRLARARHAREAARRRAEREREAMEAERQRGENETQVPYQPVFLAYGYDRHRGHRHDRDGRYRHRHRHYHRGPSAAFPSNALPSSFPDPMASSFPPGLPSSFPESPSSPPNH